MIINMRLNVLVRLSNSIPLMRLHCPISKCFMFFFLIHSHKVPFKFLGERHEPLWRLLNVTLIILGVNGRYVHHDIVKPQARTLYHN